MIKNNNYIISRLSFIAILFTFSWCIEPYDFEIKNNDPTLVIESYISDKSYNESLEYPSDGRHFEVKLKLTSDVTNKNDQPVSSALVTLVNSLDEVWQYTETPAGSGTYKLFDDAFKAQKSIQYQLRVSLANGENYESPWEELPASSPQVMGNISFEEVVKQGYVYESGEEKIRNINGIEIYVDLLENDASTPLYYRWNFDPMWIYTTSFPPRGSDYNPKCWISNNYYLNGIVLHKDNIGGYPQKLTFLETTGNHRIYKQFSLLVTQFIMNEEYYNFWKEIEEQSKKGGLFDAPPYNLHTNYKALNSNKKVSGNFGVLEEKATRWYFDRSDLSYAVEDDVVELCNIRYGPDGPGGPECYNCMEYPYGNPSNSKPSWWIE